MQEVAQICKISWTAAWKPCWKRCEEFQSRTVYCAVEYSSTNEFWNKLGSLVAKFCKAGCTSTIFIFKLLQTRTAFRRFRGRKTFCTVDPESSWTIIIHILEVLGLLASTQPYIAFIRVAGWCHTCKVFLLSRYLQVPEYLKPSTLLFKNSPSRLL